MLFTREPSLPAVFTDQHRAWEMVLLSAPVCGQIDGDSGIRWTVRGRRVADPHARQRGGGPQLRPVYERPAVKPVTLSTHPHTPPPKHWDRFVHLSLSPLLCQNIIFFEPSNLSWTFEPF